MPDVPGLLNQQTYYGPQVDQSYFGTGANAAQPTYVGPQVNPSLYPGAQTGVAPPPDPRGGDLWNQLMGAIGPPKPMPGTTVGAPAGGQPAQMPPSIPLPQGQAPAPPGAAAYLQNLARMQQQGGQNNGLMNQYLVLQQMMRGG